MKVTDWQFLCKNLIIIDSHAVKLQLKFHLHQNYRRDERYIVPYMIIVLLMSIISFQSDPTIFVQVFSVLMWKVQLKLPRYI
jgi:hypothetical protein